MLEGYEEPADRHLPLEFARAGSYVTVRVGTSQLNAFGGGEIKVHAQLWGIFVKQVTALRLNSLGLLEPWEKPG